MDAKPIDEFIKNHRHINYCEAVIDKNGDVQYVRPSHVETLTRITGEEKVIINHKMPMSESPIDWLVEYTGCISVWTNGYIKPSKINEKQKESLDKLIKAGLVENTSFR